MEYTKLDVVMSWIKSRLVRVVVAWQLRRPGYGVPATRGWRSNVRPHNAPCNGKLAGRANTASPLLVWVPPTSLQTNSTVRRTSVLVTFIILLLVLPSALVCSITPTHRKQRPDKAVWVSELVKYLCVLWSYDSVCTAALPHVVPRLYFTSIISS